MMISLEVLAGSQGGGTDPRFVAALSPVTFAATYLLHRERPPLTVKYAQ